MISRLRFSLFVLGLSWAAGLTGCQRATYATLPASPGPYYQPAARQEVAPLATSAAPQPAISPARAAAVTPHPAAKLTPRHHGRAIAPAAVAPARLQRTAVPIGKQRAVSHRAPADGFKKNPRKGLYWRLFFWGLFLTAIGIGVVGVLTASATASGGSVALLLLKEFLIALPIVAVAAGVFSATIRLIWPHDPNAD